MDAAPRGTGPAGPDRSGAPAEPEKTAYPADLEREVRLRAVQVRVRPIRPADATALVDFHARLSPLSVYLRFFGVHPELSTAEVERFTTVDYVDRMAFVAECANRLVGVARYDRLGTSSAAEVAFIVDDEYQHQGIGSLLADMLVRAARSRGVTHFVADTLADNSGMLELFRALGFPVRSAYEDSVVRIRFPIAPVPSYLEALGRREAERGVGGPADSGPAPARS